MQLNFMFVKKNVDKNNSESVLIEKNDDIEISVNAIFISYSK